MATTKLTPAQRRALEALAGTESYRLIGTTILDLEAWDISAARRGWVHPGVSRVLRAQGYVAPDHSWSDMVHITDAGRAALEAATHIGNPPTCA